MEKERQELWERVRTLEQDSDLRVDELMHENDNLHRQVAQFQARCQAQQENLKELTTTLNETQNELDSLVSEHERLVEQCRELQELAENYKRANDSLLNDHGVQK